MKDKYETNAIYLPKILNDPDHFQYNQTGTCFISVLNLSHLFPIIKQSIDS